MNIVIKELDNQGEKVFLWFKPSHKKLHDFLASLFQVSINSGVFLQMTPFLVIRHTLIMAELYFNDKTPVFPFKQIFPDENIPSGFVPSISEDEYRTRWNSLPDLLKETLFNIALEANPSIKELVEKYGQSQMELGGNPI